MERKEVNKKIILLLCLFFLTSPLRAGEIWSVLGASYKIESFGKLRTEIERRWSTEKYFYRDNVKLGTSHKLTDVWSIAPQFRLQRSYDSKTKNWNYEYWPSFSFKFSTPIGPFIYAQKNRVTYRIRSFSSNSFIFRTQTSFSLAISPISSKVQIAFEPFLDLTQGAWFLNRLSLGLSSKIGVLSLSPALLLEQRKKEESFSSIVVIGLLKVYFNF